MANIVIEPAIQRDGIYAVPWSESVDECGSTSPSEKKESDQQWWDSDAEDGEGKFILGQYVLRGTLLTSVGDYHDSDVQIVERMHGHESLVDIVLDTMEVKDAVEKSIGNYAMLCTQGIRQNGIECRMLKVSSVLDLLETYSVSEEENRVFRTRVERVETLVESVTLQVMEATGIRGEVDRYERAMKAWSKGVQTKRQDSVKAQIRRLDGQKVLDEQTA
jgi:hypothetical protein